MVLRRQTFAGHTLSVMAFPGAAAAALAGLPTALGYYVACGAAALAIGAAEPRLATARLRAESRQLIGTVQAVGLACGFLFLSSTTACSPALETLLFGTFLGVTAARCCVLLIVARGGARRCSRSAGAAACCSPRSTARWPAPAACRWRSSTRRSCCSSGWRSPPRARSPARCWCSRCWSPRRRPRS